VLDLLRVEFGGVVEVRPVRLYVGRKMADLEKMRKLSLEPHRNSYFRTQISTLGKGF